jgi:hypothetical protein
VVQDILTKGARSYSLTELTEIKLKGGDLGGQIILGDKDYRTWVKPWPITFGLGLTGLLVFAFGAFGMQVTRALGAADSPPWRPVTRLLSLLLGAAAIIVAWPVRIAPEQVPADHGDTPLTPEETHRMPREARAKEESGL